MVVKHLLATIQHQHHSNINFNVNGPGKKKTKKNLEVLVQIRNLTYCSFPTIKGLMAIKCPNKGLGGLSKDVRKEATGDKFQKAQ